VRYSPPGAARQSGQVGATTRRTGCIFKRRAPTDICGGGGGIGNGSRSRRAVSYSDA